MLNLFIGYADDAVYVLVHRLIHQTYTSIQLHKSYLKRCQQILSSCIIIYLATYIMYMRLK